MTGLDTNVLLRYLLQDDPKQFWVVATVLCRRIRWITESSTPSGLHA